MTELLAATYEEEACKVRERESGMCAACAYAGVQYRAMLETHRGYRGCRGTTVACEGAKGGFESYPF